MIWLKVGADLVSWSAWLWRHRREFSPAFHELGDFAARLFADPNGALRRVGNALVFGDEQGGGKVLAFVEQTSPRIAAIEQAVADVRVGQDVLLASLASLQTLSMVTLGLTAVTGVVLSVQLGALRKRVDKPGLLGTVPRPRAGALPGPEGSALRRRGERGRDEPAQELGAADQGG